ARLCADTPSLMSSSVPWSGWAILGQSNGGGQPRVGLGRRCLAPRAGGWQVGLLNPSTSTEKSLQFTSGLPASLMTALNAVISTR
ncbi:hypothetical protein DWU95_11845, partial [Burkholderia contaminans]